MTPVWLRIEEVRLLRAWGTWLGRMSATNPIATSYVLGDRREALVGETKTSDGGGKREEGDGGEREHVDVRRREPIRDRGYLYEFSEGSRGLSLFRETCLMKLELKSKFLSE